MNQTDIHTQILLNDSKEKEWTIDTSLKSIMLSESSRTQDAHTYASICMGVLEEAEKFSDKIRSLGDRGRKTKRIGNA